MSEKPKNEKPPSNNPLIMTSTAETLDEMHARVMYMAQWAEGDSDRRALLQEMRMMFEAIQWLQSQLEPTKIYHKQCN